MFGGFAVYIWWRWCRDELERQRIEEEGPTNGEDRPTTGPGPAPTPG